MKQTAIADELASAAELVIGQADERVPAAIIRGYNYPKFKGAGATELIRPKEKDLFLQSVENQQGILSLDQSLRKLISVEVPLTKRFLRSV